MTISKNQLKEIINLWKDGYATRDISESTNLTYNVVLYILNNNNCKPHRYVSDRKTKIPNAFSFKELTPQKAFCLGVIFGDGHVDKNQIIIYSGTKDADVLNNINKLFNNKLKIYRDYRNNGTYMPINKKKICNELRKLYNLNSNKSNNIKFPLNIHNKHMPFFISGYLAADGSISCFDCSKQQKGLHFRLSFSSCSKNFLEDLNNFLSDKTKINGGITKRKTCYTLYYNYSKAITVCDYIFNPTDENTRCDRKYKIYVEFREHLNKTKQKIIEMHNKGSSIKQIKNAVHKHESFIVNTINGYDSYSRNLVVI